MIDRSVKPGSAKRFPLLVVIALITVVFAGSIYANLSFAVKNPAHFRSFPPFERGINANDNQHLGAEYFRIARSLAAGEGFANPFPERTGPTAWMPPVFPGLLAGLLWVTEGDRDAVMAVVIFLQIFTLIGTGLLVTALAWQTGGRIGAWTAGGVFALALASEFRLCFQFTHDSWLVMLALDLVVAGFCWLRPLGGRTAAAGWGLFGGATALVNPIVTLVWGTLCLASAFQNKAWRRLGIAMLTAALALLPWTVRNAVVFGRLIPVKSNLAYELYQSQCLQADGLIESRTFATHPSASAGLQRQEYREMGEIAFLDRKRRQFWEAVRADPLDFADRVAGRFLAAMVWYVPYDRGEPVRRPVTFWLGRVTHPLPFLGLLVLVGSAVWLPLTRAQWGVLAAYLVYLLPYVVVSYYERYALALLGVKVLLVVWGAGRLIALGRRPWRRGESAVAAEAEEADSPARAVASLP